MEFKDKLRALRQERGLSQQALADAIFVSRSAVAKWENGLGLPGEGSMEALLEYFGVTREYFSTEEPEKVIERKNETIGGLLLCVGALVLMLAVGTASVLLMGLLQKQPMIGITSKAAAQGLGTNRCIHTRQYDFYILDLNVTDPNGALLGQSISGLLPIRNMGILYYREELEFTSRPVLVDRAVMDTLISFQNDEGFHNFLLHDGMELDIRLLQFTQVTANGLLTPAQEDTYFLTDAPVQTLIINGVALELGEAETIVL